MTNVLLFFRVKKDFNLKKGNFFISVLYGE